MQVQNLILYLTMRGDERCQHYLTQTFEKFLGVLRGYIATMNISLLKRKETKKREIMHASLKVGLVFKTNLTFIGQCKISPIFM